MKRLSSTAVLMMLALCMVSVCSAAQVPESTPEQDRTTIVKFYQNRLPYVPLSEYPNGVYAIDRAGRQNWEAIEEFPPYGPHIADGEEMWDIPFADGKGYRDCFPDGPAIAHLYPRWDREQGKVITLPMAINQCLKEHGEKPMRYMKGPINDILAYIAFSSRGKITNVIVPEDDPRALEAYNKGKKFYYTRRGQYNYSCANCHLQNVGKYLRSELLSPALGHTTSWPAYRSAWSGMGTLHRRIFGCLAQVRAKPFRPQSKQYRNLEYFMTYISNGLQLNGPASRK